MDNGTANARTTWYERGYHPLRPGSGLPAPGSMLTNEFAPDHCYRLAPSYAGPNAAFTDATVTSASLTPSSPARFSALSLLTASGHGPVTNRCLIYHADGTAQTNTFTAPDWFDSAPAAFAAGGRVSISTRLIDWLDSSFPRLFSVDLPIANHSSEITNILLQFVAGPNDSHTIVFALSAVLETTPPLLAPKLSIHPGQGGLISLASTAPGILQSAPSLNGTNTVWRDEGAISPDSTLTRSPIEPIRFYRVLAQ
jgi:hypothetical protein